jgi:transposase-like protein
VRDVVDQLRPYAPGVFERLETMETDLLAYTGFPVAHWPRSGRTNPIERLNCELKRRTAAGSRLTLRLFPTATTFASLLVGTIWAWASTASLKSLGSTSAFSSP